MSVMFRRVAACALTLTVAGAAQAEYPERPIQLIVPWAAGGGTDAVGRTLASGLEEELGIPVNVVNRTGAGGVVGHSAMTQAEPDGYTIGLATAEITTYHWMGTSEITYQDLTPVAQVNFDAAAFNVQASSDWETVEQALADIEANPNAYKLSGFPTGAAYHLAFAGFLNDQGIDPTTVPVVPSQGAAPGFQELAAGGVSIVASSLPESRSMREAGLVKSLAVFAEDRLDAFPKVPTAGEATGEQWVGGTWRGIVGPAGLPEAKRDRLAEAVKAVYESDAFQDFMAKRGFGTKWAGPQAFGEFMAQADEQNGVIIDKLGLAR